MTILLINPPGKTSFICPPLGLAYIAASLQKFSHRVVIIDYLLNKFKEQELLRIIRHEDPLVIGITAVTPNIKNAISLAELIKASFPDKIIVLGGPHVTLEPEKTLEKSNKIDYIVRGESEIKFPKLIECISKNENPQGISGLTFRKNNKIISTPDGDFIEDLDKLSFPARELLDIEEYSKRLSSFRKPVTTIFTSRGCPYNCIYCSKPITGQRFRSRSPQNIISEIILLKEKYNINELQFYDDSFTFDRDRVIEICRLLIENKIEIRWKCETRVNLIDEELLKTMKQAGCYLIAYGIESGSQQILDVLKKNITIKQIETAIKLTKKLGIKTVGYFMLGIPKENEKDIEQTISFSKELGLDYAQFAIAVAYPKTELYRIAEQSNKINDDWSKSIYALGGKPIISLSDIPIKRLYGYTKKAYRAFYFRPQFVFEKIKKIKSINDLIYNIKGLLALLKI